MPDNFQSIVKAWESGNIKIDEVLEKCQKVYLLTLLLREIFYYILLSHATNFLALREIFDDFSCHMD